MAQNVFTYVYEDSFIDKLKLKLTPLDIVLHSKGDPFQVHLTVST